MNIAIISDTHLKSDSGQLDSLQAEIANVNLVVHAGDYGGVWVLDYLQNHFTFAGVWGNTDDGTIKMRLPEKLIFTAGLYQVGVFHGHGNSQTTWERAYTCFEHDTVDIIIFGHSHRPMINTQNGILMLNPGSLTSKRRERWFSYILLSIGLTGLKAELVFSNGGERR